MDWDDIRPPSHKAAVLGEDLSKLGVAELEARIAELKSEIARVEAELSNKKKHEEAAAALFKR